jgi:membrane-bound lytic murein transglycosylase B
MSPTPWSARLATSVVGLGCVVVLVAMPASAGAETAAEAQERADAAAEKVEALQQRVDQARRGYERVLDQLAGAVTREISAEADADAAAQAALVAEQQQAAAVRALEQSGGQLGMISGVLQAGSPSEFVARWKLSGDMLMLLSTTSDVQRAAAQRSADLAQQTSTDTTSTMVVYSDVQEAYQRLDALLTEQQEILGSLDAEARRLAKAERLEDQIAAQRAAASAAAGTASSGATAGGIPRAYLTLYRSAATTCPGLGWPVLAAIGQVESGHGTNVGPSSAGAMGPMQFLPSTFAAYAVDGNGDGVADIWNPADAIYSAARYLCANGAGVGPRALYNAIWHYNHADWYVQMVINVAGVIAKRFGEPVPVVERP